ncbi:SusC/RagA family TonB-linked outer membrane protein [Mucilaginibacter dorajii]|uniref:TonB-dependent receptor n=1 Tax=Mucilaginibacter dorajii TaxID=692994 RepID=A0ABP7Q521_9SPHI|nr:SusC/RagA family TonB-linked outer membrane protein [Mucilaginibacter dorajii]MCS3732595.1 TonB-linked SusC/RagA family outer membrane protein [Mucilaginibacter dorajii]
MQVSAATFAQRITLNQRNTPLESVFKEIRKQSGYDFFYDGKAIKPNQRVSISVTDVSVEDALKSVLKDLPFTYEISDNRITIRKKEATFLDNVKAAFAVIDVHGRVVDEKGLPLQGVTMKLKDESQVTITDKDGNFILKKVNENAIIVISYIGYLTKEVNASADLGTITLELSNSKLDEVKVIAYGQTTERLSTGNVASVRSADIEKQPVNNPLYALQGRVAGVIVTPSSGLPGAPVTVQIRGQNSLNQKSDPLYLVDGVPYTSLAPALTGGGISNAVGALGDGVSPLSFINPNDIESISILKDADATAIYGSRGANGVILITTKTGKPGTTQVDVNVQHGISQVGHMIKMMNTQQYLSMRREALTNDGRISRLSDPAYSGVYPDLMLWDQNRYTNWEKVLIGGTGNNTDMQASVLGGTENIQYLVGGNYHSESTVFPGSNNQNKGGTHFSITGNSQDKNFSAMLTGSYIVENSTLPAIDFTNLGIITEPNAPPAYNSDGSVNWALYPATGAATTWLNLPYSALLSQQYVVKNNTLTSNVSLSYKFGHFLIKTNAGYNELRGSSYQGQPSSSYPPDFALAMGDLARTSSFQSSLVKNYSVEPQMSYNAALSKGTINVLFGAAIQSNAVESQALSLQGFSSDALLMSQDAASNILVHRNTSSQYKYNALFARVTYNYESKYLISLNARRDGSSRFGPGNQFGNFGSAAAAWIFSEENFFKNKIPFLSFGKLRFSYGTSGNDGIGDYKYLQQYISTGTTPYQGATGYMSNGLYNPYYHWETTRKMELGFESGFLKDRILFSASYFRNRSDNQLINYPFPSMAGYGNLVTNLPALIQNTGIEVTLSTVNIKTNEWQWVTNFNFTINRNKLISYPNLSNSAYAQSVIGQPFYGYVDVYKSAGVNPTTGLYQFKDANGNIVSNPSTNDFPKFGKYVRITTSPKFYGGFSNTVSYRGWSFDVFLQFTKQMGINPLYQNSAFPGASRYNQLAEISGLEWKKPGDIAIFQKFSTTGLGSIYRDFEKQSDIAYTDASFIRLKNAALSYSIPEKWRQKLRLKTLKFSIQGQNLFTITKYKGFDPETQSMFNLPPLRTIMAGIKIGF